MKCPAGNIILYSAFLLAGCVTVSSGPSQPLPTPAPETLPPAEPPHSSGAVSWRITATTEPQTYSSLLTTVITQTDLPTVLRDSLITRTLYSIGTVRSFDTVSFSGSITTFTVSGKTLESEKVDVITPVLFTGKLSNHNINTQISNINQGLNQNYCENSAQTALKVIQRNVFTLPFEMTAKQSWTDSTSSVLCNGALPTTYTVIRTLTVIGESELDGNSVLLLNQSERTFSRGEGSQGQHRIVVQSQGETSGRIYVDRSSGELLATHSTNRTFLSIQSSGRVQHFVQNSTEITQKHVNQSTSLSGITRQR